MYDTDFNKSELHPDTPSLLQIFLVSFLASVLSALLFAWLVASALGNAHARLEDITETLGKINRNGACGGYK
jgi:hypothetical protein